MSPSSRTLSRHAARPAAGSVLLALAALAALPVFWLGLTELLAAWATPEYSHGPLIPLISLYLFLRELRAVPAEGAEGALAGTARTPTTPAADARADRLPGLAVLALGLGLGLLGNLMEIGDVVAYALIVWTAGLVLTQMGWRRGRRHMLPVLHLIFMLPLPQAIYWQVTTALQGISSVAGVWIVDRAGIPVFLEGNVIDLGVYKLQVAEACSGLRYLFPILSFSYLTAILYRGPMWHKVVLFASAAPIAVAMNAVRIGVIGVLVDAYGIGAAEGFLHAFEGWAVFLVCVAILLALAAGLQRLRRDPLPLGRAIDLDFDKLGAQAARGARLPARPALGVALALCAAGAAALLAVPERGGAVPPREDFALFPRHLDEWSGAQTALDPEIEAILGADDYLLVDYAAPDAAAPVNLFVAWYADQTRNGGIHSPEVCLPAGGWEIFSLARHEVRLADRTLPVNRAIIQNGLDRQLVYYWFDQRGRALTSDFAAKLATLAERVRTGRADGALMRVTTPLGQDEDVAAADARLVRLLDDALAPMRRHVPGADAMP